MKLMEPREIGEQPRAPQTHDTFVAQALANLEATSRTKKGVSDTSSSETKPSLTIEGAALADQATNNFKDGLELVWQDRQRQFKNPEELRTWIDNLGATVSSGLLKPGQPLYRTWETKFRQTPPSKLEQDMTEFTSELYERTTNPAVDPVKTAAWVEHKLDTEIHPFADGCGRTCKLVSSWVLVRQDLPLPAHRNRDEYLKLAITGGKEFEDYYRSRIEAQQIL